MASRPRSRPAPAGDAWHEARRCDVCREPYIWNRRNKIVLWPTHAPGKRAGWVQTEAKICLRKSCLDAALARRVLLLAHVAFAPAPKRNE